MCVCVCVRVCVCVHAWACQVGVSGCRSLEELQKRNEELLAVVRELSAQNEKMEEEMGNER